MRIGKLLVTLGITLLVISVIVPVLNIFLSPELRAVLPVLFPQETRGLPSILWWIFIVLGAAVLVAERRFPYLLTLRKPSFRRDEILKAMNESRAAALRSRMFIGLGLIALGISLFVVSFALSGFQLSPAVYLWIFAVVLPLVIAGSILWFRRPFLVQMDQTCSLKIPLATLNNFHISLRHKAEDAGFVVTEDVPPNIGATSTFKGAVFAVRGGFVATRKILRSPLLLLIGISLLFAGITLIAHSSIPWIPIAGVLVFFAGIGFFIYLAVRQKQRGEIRVKAKVNVLEEGSASGSECNLAVTVSAVYTQGFDEKELEKAFTSVISAIDESGVETNTPK